VEPRPCVSAPSSDVDGPRDAVPAPSDVDSELDATIPDVQACWDRPNPPESWATRRS